MSQKQLIEAGQVVALEKSYELSVKDKKCDHTAVIRANKWWKPSHKTSPNSVSNSPKTSSAAGLDGQLGGGEQHDEDFLSRENDKPPKKDRETDITGIE